MISHSSPPPPFLMRWKDQGAWGRGYVNSMFVCTNVQIASYGSCNVYSNNYTEHYMHLQRYGLGSVGLFMCSKQCFWLPRWLKWMPLGGGGDYGYNFLQVDGITVLWLYVMNQRRLVTDFNYSVFAHAMQYTSSQPRSNHWVRKNHDQSPLDLGRWGMLSTFEYLCIII